ncbi:hypothetical protein K2Z83_05060 [Oscillochloris sp. ZM17-4]|uniref:clostripain-related cysteine peptidase n=1 Tax=Oscillochloris sp. ZM17-4 TaxID=2866714 RepID=UPI001C736A21|nr:clostripain-related cysteine peptidase [Oscillochloris sp. ZM17-4]MBX0327052.1 hypothetical protein [Oscillochloris sp. ZM17-4]
MSMKHRPPRRRAGVGASILIALALTLVSFSFPAPPPARAAGVIYVVPGGTGDGSSWAQGQDLAAALAAAVSGDELWVAAGTYTPTTGTDRTATFQLKSGVAIYGGFAGTETARDERNWAANVVTLSGDIGAAGNADNSYHVVTGASNATLDGVTISGGNANGGGMNSNGGGMLNISSSLMLSNITFSSNSAADRGGGLYNSSSSPTLTNITFSGNNALVGGGMGNAGSNPTLTNVIFSSNSATSQGGGLYNESSSPTLINSIFSGNSSAWIGGGLSNGGGSPTLRNVTISGNSASTAGGGMSNLSSANPQIYNSIIWGNTAPSGATLYNNTSTPSISFSLVQYSGGSAAWNSAFGTNGGGNLDTDPLFVDAGADNLRLLSGSPAIDVGNNALVIAATDLDGNPRIVGSAVDMGSYEYGRVRYVSASAVGANDGSSWANAYTDLQSALAAASGEDIWVAAGTYKPTTGADRNATFQLKSGVAIYGGFAGTETARDQRDWAANLVTLSGDLLGNDNGTIADTEPTRADNSCHVVRSSSVSATAILDGVTISGGNANCGAWPGYLGGGMFNVTNGSPTLSNVTFSGNSANIGSGMTNYSGSSPIVSNVIFSGNSASGYAGAMYNNYSSPTLSNVAISGNSGGISNTVSSPTIRNSIIWGNGYAIGGSAASVSYSLIEGGYAGTGNLDIDPLFINASGGDLRLRLSSPAINAGNNAVTNPALPATDMDGQPRVFANTVDMGAYEVQAPVVSRIMRAGSDPTNAASVSFLVSFDLPVSGVDSSDFSLTTTGGQSGASITLVSGGGSSWFVTVATVDNASGTIRLDLIDNDTIIAGAFGVLGGAGTVGSPGDASFARGEVYTVDRQAPTLSLNAPATITLANRASYPISGSCTSGDNPVHVVLAGVSGDIACSAGSFSGSLNLQGSVIEGSNYSLSASQTDAAGNLGNAPGQAALAQTIASQPASQAIVSGMSATLSVSTTDAGPYSYQWYRGGSGDTSAPVGANSPRFTTPALTADTTYWVRISHSNGSVASNTATVSLNPLITAQPQSQTITLGGSATITVTASSLTPMSYQWYQGSSGDTSTPVGTDSLSFTTPALSADTSYWVRITNTNGSTDSQSARVTLGASVSVGTSGQLSAVSPTGFVLTRDITSTSPLTVSFTLAGNATPDDDYEITGATPVGGHYSAVIPASISSVTVTISLKPVATVGRTVAISLTVDPAYAIGDPSSAHLNILPVITVSASGNPSRHGPVPGTFTLTCPGCQQLSAPLSVGFALGGSAAYGSDYALTGPAGYAPGPGGGSVTFTPQTTSISLVLTPTASSQDGETVSLTLSDGAGYVPGKPADAALAIDGTPPPPWLVLLYLAGDDGDPQTGKQSLTPALLSLITALDGMPYNPNMRLVVLYDGNANGDSRIYVREQLNLRDVTDEVRGSSLWYDGFPADNELDTGSVITLQNFIRWARTTYPGSTHTMLSIVDHGGGWAPDLSATSQYNSGEPDNPQPGGLRGMSVDWRSGNALSTRDTGEVLRGLGALGRFDLIFFDACLMGMVESAYEVAPYTSYLVAGENLLWAKFPYEQYFDPARLTATLGPRALAELIVELYNQPLTYDAQGVITNPFVIAAIDTAQLSSLANAVRQMAIDLLDAVNADGGTAQTLQATTDLQATVPEIEGKIRSAYANAQKFDYDANLRIDQTDGYVDLAHLAQMLEEQHISAAVDSSAQDVHDLILQSVVITASKTLTGRYSKFPEWDFSNATGLSIYMPIGERDCRPTGPIRTTTTAPGAIWPCTVPLSAVGEPVAEWQLDYYGRPQQLSFSADVPEWAALLKLLDPATPERVGGPYGVPIPLGAQTQIYLPVVMNRYFDPVSAPDLAITGVEVLPAQPSVGQAAELRVTITNRGTRAAVAPFWVDLYVDPLTPPEVNQVWSDLSSTGVSWRVYGLGAGQSKVLSSLLPNDPQAPGTNYSDFRAFVQAGPRQIYALVDAFAGGSPTGAIDEADETNNRFGPLTVNVAP